MLPTEATPYQHPMDQGQHNKPRQCLREYAPNRETFRLFDIYSNRHPFIVEFVLDILEESVQPRNHDTSTRILFKAAYYNHLGEDLE